ncbi:hypothetical protein AB0L30_31755 [Microbispora rosea]|uniref:hypothetical protein n=1 Tax=Microbispora rosea TaxID=58117 RepID=UPI003418B7F8
MKKVMGVSRPGSRPRQIAYNGLVDEVAPNIRAVHPHMDNAIQLDYSSVIVSARKADLAMLAMESTWTTTASRK